MKTIKLYLFLLLLMLSQVFAMAQTVEVLVAAHRGDWRNYAENSIEAIESCIRMGVDVVEIDVAKTKDGHLILMHDRTVDRATSGKGLVSDFTLAEIQKLRLRNGLGSITDFKIPTFEEAMIVAKDRIIVDVDKADEYMDDVYEILKKTGTLKQAFVKSDKPYNQLYRKYGVILEKMIFVPVIRPHKETTIDSVAVVLNMECPVYEISFAEASKELFQQMKAKLQNTASVLWFNSLWDSNSGGYTDDKALTDPNGNYGYLIDTLGARIIQTDRPAYLLEYLRKKGLHD
ncbi:MAG: glycerophosphodiester phosphodiesterase family protein [Tannerella sp.]|jgi:glycerophosphoryl diester phosphodiesterase|nr:glycerophosphodiester phosphodiesterase family protein [Tannerella sp.]